MTLETVRHDLALTITDAVRCKTIHDNIVDFIRNAGDEDRSTFNVDRLKWQVLYERATRLQLAIEAKLNELETVAPTLK